MIHPHTELQFINDIVGYGVVATKFIPKGTVTWVLDKLDRSFNPEDINHLEPEYLNILETYCYRNNKGQLVLCWDIARFVNHSFKANCLSTAYDFEIAIRDIEPGEQLTDDYGYLNITEPFRGIDEGTKRKIVYPDDILRYYPLWDKQVLSAIKKMPNQKQPLLAYMPEKTVELAHAVARGEKELQSILTCYYNASANGDDRLKHSESKPMAQ